MNEPRKSRLVNLSLLRSSVPGLLGAARRQRLARDPTAWVIAGTTLCAFGVMHAGEGLCRLLVPADWKSVLADRTDDLSEEEWFRRSYGNLRGRIAAGALKTEGSSRPLLTRLVASGYSRPCLCAPHYNVAPKPY